MAEWTIRLSNQPAIRVEIEDHRNLAEEFDAFNTAYESRPRWRWWKRTDPFWHPTADVTIHTEMIAGVAPRRKTDRPVLGFL